MIPGLSYGCDFQYVCFMVRERWEENLTKVMYAIIFGYFTDFEVMKSSSDA